jgi:hypothetical protein
VAHRLIILSGPTFLLTRSGAEAHGGLLTTLAPRPDLPISRSAFCTDGRGPLGSGNLRAWLFGFDGLLPQYLWDV